MKRIFCYLILFALLFSFTACQNGETPEKTEESTEAFTFTEEDELSAAISQIPSDQYVTHTNQHGRPLSATLYKNGEVMEIDVNDPRLVRLINFFNAALYRKDCAYSLGYLPFSNLEANVTNQDFRLELKYQPCGEKVPSPYSAEYAMSDTVVITGNQFVVINHDRVAYENAAKYPVLALSYIPLEESNALWLDLFGF